MRRVVWYNFTDVSELRAASIINATSNLHTGSRKNLKSHFALSFLFMETIFVTYINNPDKLKMINMAAHQF